MKARPTHSAPIQDAELARLLSSQQEVLLEGPERAWREVERQVERLGFGESFVVSFSEGKRGGVIRIRPLHGPKHST